MPKFVWVPTFVGMSVKTGIRKCVENDLAISHAVNYVHEMFFTYIITNKPNGTLYTGHTDDLSGRVWEHKQRAHNGFASKYGCDLLVWFETHQTRDGAFRRERQIKEWHRAWKIKRIEVLNPKWDDLYAGLTEANVFCDARVYRHGASGSRPSTG